MPAANKLALAKMQTKGLALILRAIKNGRFMVIPGGPDTYGHGTTAFAQFWKKELAELIANVARGKD